MALCQIVSQGSSGSFEAMLGELWNEVKSSGSAREISMEGAGARIRAEVKAYSPGVGIWLLEYYPATGSRQAAGSMEGFYADNTDALPKTDNSGLKLQPRYLVGYEV